MVRSITLAVLVVIVSACDTKPKHPSADYLARLNNVLSTSTVNNSSPILEFPSVRDLRHEQKAASMSIREFLSLRECALHTTIAKRNSLIGKVATASQILFNDIELIAQGPACLKIVEDPALNEKLKQFLDDKRGGLPRMLAHALLEQKEHAEFWRLRDIKSNYPQLLDQESIPNLKALGQFVDAALGHTAIFSQADYESVENNLGQIRFGDGGRLLWEYSQLINDLQQANHAIEQRLASPLCLKQQTNPKARYFQNVVNTFFIAKVQPHAVLLNQRATALMSAHSRLEKPLLDTTSESYKNWAATRNELLRKGRSATTTHVGYVQKLFRQCGLVAGNR